MKKLSLLALLLFVFLGSYAGTITSTTSGGNWSNTSTWVGGVAPTSADYVVINGDVTVAANTTCKALTVNSGKTLTINSSVILTVDYSNIDWNGRPEYTISNAGTIILASGGDNELSINSNNGQSWNSINNTGTITANSGKISIQRNTNASFFDNTGAFNAGTGIVEFKGSNNVESSVSSSLTFNNVIVNGNLKINMNGATVNGKLQLINGGNFGNNNDQDTRHPVYGSNAILEISGSYGVSTHTILWATNYTSYSNRIAPNIVINSGTVTADQGRLYLRGTFTVKSGATFNGGSGCLFIVSGFQSIINENGGTLSLGGVIVQNGAVWNVNNNYKLATLKIENGGTVNANSYTLNIENSTINNCGGISGIMQLASGGTFNAGTGTVIFKPAYWSNVTADVTGPITFNNLVATGTEPLVVPAASTVNVNGNITVEPSAKVELPQNINYGAGASVTNNGTIAGTTNNFPAIIPQTPPTSTTLTGIGGGSQSGVASIPSNNSYTLNANLTITGTRKVLTVAPSAELIINDKTIEADTVYVYGKLKVSNTSGLSAIFVSPTKVILRSGSTVEYTSSTAQTITARTDYVNLQLTGAGAKTFAAGTYSVSGDLTVTGGAANITTNSTTFNFNGTNAQNIKGLPYNNVTFLGSGNKTLSDTSKVTGVVNVNGSANLISNGLLVLKSDAAGTASVGPITPTANITGPVTVERYIPTGRKWRFLSLPLTGVTFTNSWQKQIHITGPGSGGGSLGTTNSNGFDWTQSVEQSAFYYSETGSGNMNERWVAITSPSVNIDPMKGYRIFVRGDRRIQGNTLIDGSLPTPSSVTLSATGYLVKGAQTFNLTCSNGCTSGDGWNLVSNPYPSTVNWDNTNWAVARSGNIKSTIYVYNPVNAQYGAWNPIGGSVNGCNGYIASGQSFFIKTTGSATLTFQEEYKVDQPTSGLFGKSGVSNRLKLSFKDTAIISECVVFYENNSTKAPNDKYDAPIMSANYGIISTFTTESTTKLLFNGIGHGQDADTILVYLPLSKVNKSYTLGFIDVSSFPTGVSIKLTDAYTNQSYDVRTLSDGYIFSTVSENSASTNAYRFTITFGDVSSLPVIFTYLYANKTEKGNSLKWQTASEVNNSHFEIERSNDGIDFTAIGVIKGKGNSTTSTNYEFVDAEKTNATTVYYRLKQVDFDTKSQYSNTVVISLGASATLSSQVVIFPVPAQNVINIDANSIIQNIVITDITGKEYYQSEVNADKAENISVEYLNQGVYFVQIQYVGGKKETIKFVKE